MKHVIVITDEEAKTLLRCLAYGAAATSQWEEKTGEAAKIRKHVRTIRKQVQL